MIHELVRNVTSSLEQKGIPYMISGSLAFNMYCIPRMSMDIDLVIELNLSNLNYINLWCKNLDLKTFGLIQTS